MEVISIRSVQLINIYSKGKDCNIAFIMQYLFFLEETHLSVKNIKGWKTLRQTKKEWKKYYQIGNLDMSIKVKLIMQGSIII